MRMALLNPQSSEAEEAVTDTLNHTRLGYAAQRGLQALNQSETSPHPWQTAMLWQLIYLYCALSSELEKEGPPSFSPSMCHLNLLLRRWHLKLPKIPA